jgi:autotransporter-associated beta strand protein/predicted outer membrane repeat protein
MYKRDGKIMNRKSGGYLFRLRVGLGLLFALTASALWGQYKIDMVGGYINVNSASNFANGIWLGRGTLYFLGDAPGAFGSQSTVRNNSKGQIIIGRYGQGGPLDTNAVSSFMVSSADITVGYRIQILSLDANSSSYLSYSLGINTGGKLLTISGVQNLSNETFNWVSGTGKTGMYKYGGAIGVYGSMASPSSDTADAYRSWNSFLVFTGGSKLRLTQNQAQFGGAVGFYKEGGANYGGYYFDFKPLAYLDVSENTARGHGGGMYFYSNMSADNASANRQLVVDLGLHTSFRENNTVGQGGGIAIYHGQRQIELTIQGDTYFKGNTAGTKGGAIFAGSGMAQSSATNTGGFITLDATSGIIAFSGNKANNQANSIHAELNNRYLVRAVHNVYFDDPISSGSSTGVKGNTLTKTGAGILQFAGGASVLNSGGSGGGVSVDQGTFRVVKDSSFTTAGSGAAFTMSPTTTLAGGGRISAGNVNLTSVTVSPDSAQLKIPEYNLETNTFASPVIFIEASQKTGTLTLAGTTYLNGVTLDVDILSRTDYDKLVVSGGSVTFAGANIIKVNSWNSGRYNVLTVEGTGTINTITGVTAQAGWEGSASGRKSLVPGLSGDKKTLYIDMLASNALLSWSPTGSEGVWDTAEGNKAWSHSGGTDSFLTGDYVIFNGAAPVVNIPSELEVYGMEVSGGQYTFNNGIIRGLRTTDPLISEYHNFDLITAAGKEMGKLTVSGGTTTANFNNPVDFSAADIIAGAKVTVNNVFKISGSLIISGAGSELIVRGVDPFLAETPIITVNTGGALVFNKVQDFEYAGIIAGSGGILRKLGPGAMTISGSNTFTGTTDISAGSVILGGSISNSTVTMAEGTLLNVSTAAAPLIKGLSGAGRVVLGTKVLTVEGGGTYQGVIEGAGGLTKAGTGTLTLSGQNTYTGATVVRGGTLALASGGGIAAGELVMEGGTFDISSSNASAASPLVIERLTGPAADSGIISIGTKALRIGNSPSLPGVRTYNGNFTGDRAGTIDFNTGQGSTLRLGGKNGQLYQGIINVNEGTLELTTGNALGGSINVNTNAGPGTKLTLEAANALAVLNTGTGKYESNARIDLRGTASLEVRTGSPQTLERLVSGRDSNINLNNTLITLKSGVLEGRITGVGGITKTVGTGYGVENTLTIAANLNPDSGGAATNMGNLKVESGSSAGGNNTVELRDGVKLAANAIELGDYTMLSLSATGSDIITTNTLTIGEHQPGGKGVGTIINITNYGGQASYDLIKVSGGSLIGEFETIYVNGRTQPSSTQLTVHNYFAPVAVVYDTTSGPDKYVRVNSAGLLWKAVNNTAHGYFWIEEGSVITVTEKLENNTYVMRDLNTGDVGRHSLRDDEGRYWDGKTLIKEGGGTLVLNPSGADVNGYTGDTQIRNGILQISKQSALGGTGKIAVSAGAVFNLDGYGSAGSPETFSKNITGAGNLLISGGSAVSLTGTGNNYTGSTIIAGGTLLLQNNAAIVSSQGLVLGSGGTFDISGIGTLGSVTGIKRLDDRGTEGYQDTGTVQLGKDQSTAKDLEIGNGAGEDSSFTGLITGWGTIIKSGDHALRLGGASDFHGRDQTGLIFKKGSLILANDRALGIGENRLLVEGGTRITLERVEIDNPITMKNRLEIYVDEYQDSGLKGVLSFQGVAPSDYLIKKTGSGALTIYGENNYDGNTNLENGTLVITGNSALGNGALVVSGDAANIRTLRLEKTASAADNLNVPTNISLQDDAALNIDINAGEATLSGIIEGSAAITKRGNGTLILTKPQKYTGLTQILAGDLVLSGSGDLAASSGFMLNFGSTLDISGISGNTSTTINGLSGSGIIELGEHTLTINTAAEDNIFAGVIRSAKAGDPEKGGGLIKEGGKILSLYGQSTLTGETLVKAGALHLEENDALAFSKKIVVEGGASLIGNGSQTFKVLESKAESIVNLRNANVSGGRLEGTISAVNIKKIGADTELILDTNVTNMFTFELAEGELAVRTGIQLTSRDFQVRSGTKLSVSVDPQHSGEYLDGAAGVPIVVVEAMKIEPGAAIYVDGFNTYGGTDGLGQYLIARSETPIDGMFDIIAFEGSNGNFDAENHPITIDVYHNGVGTSKSFDGKEIYVVDRGLVWFNSASNTAHGTFMVNGTVTISANLSDRHAISGEIFLRDPADPSGRTPLWDGKTLTKRGAGTLILTGTNYYENTVIESGTVELHNDTALKNTTGKVVFNAPAAVPGEDGQTVESTDPPPTLVLNYAQDDYFSTPVTGEGELIKRGPGAVVITGESDFTGTTVVETGMIAIGTVDVSNGVGKKLELQEEGALAVASLDQIARWRQDGTFAPAAEEDPLTAEVTNISGSGSILLMGENTLRVTGASDFGGLLSGTGVIEQYGTGGALTLGRAQGEDFTGTVSVDGFKVVLTEPNAITKGSLRVKTGTLESAADQLVQDVYLGAERTSLETAAIDLGSGKLSVAGSLSGNGFIKAGELAIVQGGIYAPGNSPGEVRVDGNVTFEAGSMYRIDLDITDEGSLGDTDLLAASGTVVLREPQVDLAMEDITKVRHSHQVPIITTDGGGTGKFQDWNYLFFDGDYSYSAWLENGNADSVSVAEGAPWNQVLLSVARNKNELTPYAKSRNQQSVVGAIIDSEESNPELFRDLMLLRNTQEGVIQPLLDHVTGEIYADLPAFILELDWNFGKNIRNRFRAREEALAGKFPLWTSVEGIYLTYSGDGNAADYTALGGEMELGMEFSLGTRGFLGVAFRGGYNMVEVPERNSTGDLLGFGGGLYGGALLPLTPGGNFKLGAGAAYGMTVGNITREINSTIQDEIQESEYTAHSVQGLLDLGFEYAMSEWVRVEPYVGAAVHTVLTQPIGETKRLGEGDAENERGYYALDGEGSTYWNVASLLGLRSRISLTGAIGFEIGASWRHIFGELTPEQTVRMEDIRDYSVWGIPLNDNAVDLGVGFEFLMGKAVRMNLGYNIDVGRSIIHQANLGFTFIF